MLSALPLLALALLAWLAVSMLIALVFGHVFRLNDDQPAGTRFCPFCAGRGYSAGRSCKACDGSGWARL